MLNKLKNKLFKRSKKETIKDIHFLCLEISYLLEDISEDLEELHESVRESNRLILDIQEQCNQIIAIMEKNKGNADE